jgi:hypothetical protein
MLIRQATSLSQAIVKINSQKKKNKTGSKLSTNFSFLFDSNHLMKIENDLLKRGQGTQMGNTIVVNQRKKFKNVPRLTFVKQTAI